MGLYDRDYMRGEVDPPPDLPLDERVAARVGGFVRRHPRLIVVVVGIVSALIGLAAATAFFPG